MYKQENGVVEQRCSQCRVELDYEDKSEYVERGGKCRRCERRHKRQFSSHNSPKARTQWGDWMFDRLDLSPSEY